MIVVDTTVLVYAVGTNHPLQAPCRSLVERVARGDVQATTTVEVIQEFTHVRARRRTRSDAVALARSYADLFAPLLLVESGDLVVGLTMFEANDRLGPFDAVLAATAIRRGASGLVSADAAFARVHGLRYLDPSTRGFLDDLDP